MVSDAVNATQKTDKQKLLTGYVEKIGQAIQFETPQSVVVVKDNLVRTTGKFGTATCFQLAESPIILPTSEMKAIGNIFEGACAISAVAMYIIAFMVEVKTEATLLQMSI